MQDHLCCAKCCVSLMCSECTCKSDSDQKSDLQRLADTWDNLADRKDAENKKFGRQISHVLRKCAQELRELIES